MNRPEIAVSTGQTFIKTNEMKRNTEFILKSGAAGARMDFQLFDENGAVDLAGADVFLTLTRRIGGEQTRVKNAKCSKDANQYENRGKCSFVFTKEQSALEPGEYNLEIKAEYADGRAIYFPAQSSRAFGTVLVQPTLS